MTTAGQDDNSADKNLMSDFQIADVEQVEWIYRVVKSNLIADG